MQFFASAITTLQTLVVALGAGLGVWGVVNLLEGYGSDNPGSKSWRIPQGSPSSLWEGVSKFHYPPRCHRARFAESGLRLRRSLGWLFRNHLLEANVVAAHLMPLSRGFCACIMVYSVFNVR